ncbi:Arc family DNA-binding protein [Deefgea rivuli]|uniref:Arc family DNA-binding protein n=1 Tax=Deefgea rivuli TaxID=400948 RepID=UPI000487688A|nr:Arc family DNA-binding protein [Deefgea rivuli]
MKNNAPSQSADKYILRYPDGMREQIAAAAKANNRSMNAEIVARLQSSFEQEDAKANHAAGETVGLSDQIRLIVREELQTFVVQLKQVG